MKINRREWIAAIKNISGAMDKSNIILRDQLFIVNKDNQISLVCWDRYNGMRHTYNTLIDYEHDLQRGIDLKKTLNLLQKIESDEIDLTFDDKRAHFRIGGEKYTLATNHVEQILMHDQSVINIDFMFNIPSDMLRTIISRVEMSISKSTPHFYFISFHCENNELRVTATNGNTLSISYTPLNSRNFDFVLPYQSIVEIKKLLKIANSITFMISPDTANIHTDIDDSRYLFQHKLSQDRFPDISWILNEEKPLFVQVNTSLLRSKFQQMSAVLGQSIDCCRMTITGDVLKLYSCDYDSGIDGTSEIQIDGSIAEFEIYISTSFMIKALGTIHTEFAIISFEDDPKKSIHVKPTEGSYFHVLMPLRKE